MASDYRPRRASKRWLDGDCPEGVLAIFDNPKFADRYTVFYARVIRHDREPPYLGYRSMSDNPYHPQGVGLYGEMKAYEVANYRYHNKRRACKWSDLPEKVKQLVRQDLSDS